MTPRRALGQPALFTVAIALLLSLGACSSDDSGVAGVGGSGVEPLSSRYWPLEVGSVWTYVRVENGVFSPDTTIDYYDDSLPAAHRSLEVTAAGRIRSLVTSQAGGAGAVFEDETLDFQSAGGALQATAFVATGTDTIDNSEVFYPEILADGAYDWLRFDRTRWVSFEVSYAADSMLHYFLDAGLGPVLVDLGEDRYGKILFEEALGFGYERYIYSGGIDDLDPGDAGYWPVWSDVDNDVYLDGVERVRLVGEVVGNADFAYADLGAKADSLFPQLKDVVYTDCKWVRFSLEADVYVTNQRDPNAGPGQPAINWPYSPMFSIDSPARRDLAVLLLAPDVGPVVMVDYSDFDKEVSAGDPDAELLMFVPDLVRTDYLVDYTP